MANVNIKFNGKEFLLSCDNGQEEHLEELSLHLNKKFNELKNNLGNIGENKLLLITSIKIMDEYFETRKKINEKKQELKDLSNKFRELKSLVYEYKTNKEEEIIREALIEMGADIKNVEKIVKEAVKKEKDSNQILDFTKQIKNISEQDKKIIVEALWNIIYSDENADMYETNLMRRLAGLLYLDNKIVGDIKEKVKQKHNDVPGK